MNGLFSFHKKDKTSFEIKEESLEHIKMPNKGNEPTSIIDEIQTGYDDPIWIEKSNSIKARDNYTCQLCHSFNPMQNCLIYIQQGEYETYHQYDSRSYLIHVKDYNFTLNFDFQPGYHLAMPRLNVHHKIYYKNRDLWDYPDDCLVTLCEHCHHYIHSLNEIVIPVFEENPSGHAIPTGRIRPKPYDSQLDHTDLGTFQPLALVKENKHGIDLTGQDAANYEMAKRANKKWYDYHEILGDDVIHINYLRCDDPQWNKHTPEEIKKVADFITSDFIENILGFSKKN